MNMNQAAVAFYTDVGRLAGSGHIIECKNLAAELIRRSSGPVLFFSAQPKHARSILGQEKWRVVPAPAMSEPQRLTEALRRAVSDYHIRVLVFDASVIDPGVVRALKREVTTCVITEKKEECTGQFNFDIAWDPRSALVAEAFLKRRNSFSVRRTVNRIAIAFGSSDPYGLTCKSVEQVSRMAGGTFPALSVIVGGLFKHGRLLRKVCRAYPGKADIYSSVKQDAFIRILRASDVFISAGGDMMYEAAVIGSPMVIWPPSPKQAVNAICLFKGYRDSRMVIMPDYERRPDAVMVPRALAYLADRSKRQAMRAFFARRQIADGVRVISGKILKEMGR